MTESTSPRFSAQYIAANRIEFNTNDVENGYEPTPYVMIERPADNSCACGCEEEVTNAKRNFRPGHDQRLMGILVRAEREGLEVSWMSGGLMISGSATDYGQLVLNEGGQAKLARYIATEPKRARKGRTSAAQAAEVIAAPARPAFTEGEVKIGRWVYPSREFPNGAVVRNTKRDGSGEWVDV
jgi:hypothetical protein